MERGGSAWYNQQFAPYRYYSSNPVQVRGIDNVGYLRYIIAISAGRSGQHSLAVDANGFAYGWGYNKYGQCGNGESGEVNCELTPVKVKGVGGAGWLENIVDVSGGQMHSMTLQKLDPCQPGCNGRVYTFGSNKWPADWGEYQEGYGKLGNGNTVDDFITTPVRVLKGQQDTSTSDYLENIIAISAGWDHCMALEKYDPLNSNYKGRVYTWGSNGPGWGNDEYPWSVSGRLGNGTTNSSSTPVMVLSGQQNPNNPSSYLKGIIAVGAGEGHSMAVDVNGFVYCWGDNYSGQLGNGTYDPCTRPVKVVGPDLNHNGIHEPNEGYLENIVAISAGFWHCLAIDADGTIWTWGKGAYGRLGLGDSANRNIPHRIPIVYNIMQESFYFRIQDAIDEANNGDVIEASMGTYYENINFPADKSITVRSTDPDNSNVVSSTIIDALNYNCVVTFNSNSGSTLAGFTIKNGALAGVYCYNSNPNIIHCNIEDNDSSYGGISCENSNPNIINCNIQNNNCYSYGGIVCYNSDPNITNCNIKDNSLCGIYCMNYSDPNIVSCNIEGNKYYYGGIYCDNSNPNITDSLIARNGNEYSYYGGMYNNSSSPTVTNCVFRENRAYYGGGIRNYSSSPKVINCIFSGNIADYDGGGIQNQNSSSPTVTNCTFRGNIADYRGGGMYNEYYSSPVITNCIFWGDTAADGNEIYNYYSSTPYVSYCDIQDDTVYPGTGNINADPLFYDDPNDPNNFHLDQESPCIDAGDPFADYTGETDIDGEDRVKDGDANGTEIVDMGADEFYWSPADFNDDRIVNFIDYAIFANAWNSNNSNSNWNPKCDIAIPANNLIDFNDLAVFCEDWLWQAGWDKPAGFMMMGQDMSEAGTAAFAAAKTSSQSVSEQQIEKVSPLKIEQLIDWLEQLWLDPETQKLIDENIWLKFIESLKEEL